MLQAPETFGRRWGMTLDVGGRGLAFKELREMNSPWRTVLHLATRCVLSKGERISLGRKLYFLEQGKVRLTQQSLEGTEKILWYIHEGCLFGETPFFDPLPSEGYFICSVESVVYAFSAQSLDIVRREYPDLLMNLARSMARKMRALSHQAASLYLDSVLVRTCKFLAQRIVPGSDPPIADVGISRREMAALLGVHRISLYKILRQQEEIGLLGPFVDRRVVVLRPAEFFDIIRN